MKTETIQEMAGMQDGAIVSKILTQNGSTTLFALAQGEEIQEHTSTRTALAIVLEGRIIFTVDGEEKEIQGMEQFIFRHLLYMPCVQTQTAVCC